MSEPYPLGPNEADEIREGDGYELSGSYKIQCLPVGGRGSDAAATGAAVLKSDPDVEAAGVETGYSPSPETLRAPDVPRGAACAAGDQHPRPTGRRGGDRAHRPGEPRLHH